LTLRTNPMIAALGEGKVQFGTWLYIIRNPAILTLLRSVGLDFVRLDLEHCSPSVETVADMALLSRALDLPLIVRPPSGSREWVTRLLDLGVWGLHIPQVDTPEDAEAVVVAARYAPVGMRGMSSSAPHNDYTPGVDTAVLDAQIHLTVMLESKSAFGRLDEILSVPGIDAVTLGPRDLAQELGVLGTKDQARVIDEYREVLIEGAQRHGKDVAMLCNTRQQAQKWIDAGAKIIVLGSDVAVLQNGYTQVLADLGRTST
jgi:2-keto-3-deoxy-L-rhamnonate aldolase RhmA